MYFITDIKNYSILLMSMELKMNFAQKIAKNVSLLFIAQILSVIFGFFYVIYMARYLGAANFGILSFAIAFTGIFGIISDLGLTTLAVREISKDKSLESCYITNITLIKFFLSILTIGLTLLSLYILGYPKLIFEVVLVILLSVIMANFTQVFSSIFQVHQKLEYQSLSTVLSSILMFSGIILAINYNFGILQFAYIYLIVSFFIFIFNLLIYLLKFISKVQIDLSAWRPLIIHSIPLGLLSIFVFIFIRVDTVMLSKLIGDSAVGWYNAAFILVQNLGLITGALMTVLFPLFSQLKVTSKNSFKELYDKSFKYLLIITIPIGIGTFLLSDSIILLIFGNQYVNSIIALQILIWWYVIGSISWLIGTVLNSTNKQNLFIIASFISLVFNISLNLYLIPILSYIGASIVTIATELLLFCILYYYFPKNIYKPSLNLLFKPLLAAIIMGVFIYIFKWINLFPLVAVAIVIYLIALVGLGGIDEDDIGLLKRIFKQN